MYLVSMGLFSLPFLAFVRDVLNFGRSSGNRFLSFSQTRNDQVCLRRKLMATASEPAFAPAVTVLLRFVPYSDRDDREPASSCKLDRKADATPSSRFNPILLPHELQIARA